MLDFFLIIDNSYKPYLNRDTAHELNKLNRLLTELEHKEIRLRKGYIDGFIDSKDYQDELKIFISQKDKINNKISKLCQATISNENKNSIKLIYNFKQLEKSKEISYQTRKDNLWNHLTREQKQSLVFKYLDLVEIEYIKQEIIIHNIKIKESEIENIGYMFRNDCFDLVTNINANKVIISNPKSEQDINDYINSLSNYYKITKQVIDKNKLDLNSITNNNLIHIIPNKNEKKFGSDKYTMLEIGT